MNKRVFTIMIALLLAAFVPKAYGEAWDGTTKTEVTPSGDTYTIKNGAELAWVAQQANATAGYFINKTILLAGNIDLGGKAWTPIDGKATGDIDGGFTGTFDGCGFTISNLTVTVTGSNYAGLFALIGKGGTVKNLGVTGTSVTGNNESGGIAGTNSGTIQNCYSSVTVKSTATANHGAGGIAGYNVGTILNCYTTGAVTCETSYAGGIAGANANADGGAKIQYCYATGAIKGNEAGGIAGNTSIGGSILNCIALNDNITGKDPGVGRITGYREDGVTTLTANYAAPSIPGTWADKGTDKKNGADLTEANFIKDSAFGSTGAFYGWNRTDDWDMMTTNSLPWVRHKQGDKIGGQTTIPSAPYLVPPVITTKEELAAIKNNLAGSYKLGGNITLTGWSSPISGFTGTLNGCGYVITLTDATASLFKTINEGGTVKNLGIKATITADAKDDKVGGIAATNKGTIQRCYVEGSITSTGVYISGIADNQGTIEDCYTTVSITTTGYYSGGIAGSNSNGTIQRCYATGAISSPGSAGIAGAGINTNSIQDCIALNESITGTGTLHARVANSDGTFTGNYASPAIAGTWKKIGADKNDGADLTAANFIGKGAGEGAFTAWSGDIWDFGDNTNLPTLKGFKADQPVKGITRKSVIPLITAIATAEDLATFRDAVNNDGESYKGRTVTLTADITVSDWAKSIGSDNKPFLGTLDGDGYVITLTDATASLFGTINAGGTVKDLGVKGKVESSTDVGGIAKSNSGTIQNCYTSVELICTGEYTSVGGIVGSNSGMIQNCYSTGKITSKEKNEVCGGIAGKNIQGATIQYCYATGTLDGGTSPTAGIASDNTGTVRNCIALNTGGITSSSNYKYRIANSSGSGTIANCFASPAIPGAWSNKGVNAKNGADLPSSFDTDVADTGVFAGWKATDWNIETVNLPFLQGFKADQPVKDMKRTPFLEVPVTTITDQKGLADIAKDLSGSYKLGGNIILTGTWTPLGDNINRFTGTLDGCGYTISGLNVSMTETTDTYAGLFGAIDKDGTVKNLGVTGSVTVTTTGIDGYAYAGGIAGLSTGKIMNCYTNVTVDATGSVYTYAGGIVGYFSNADPAISNCFATGNCTATSTGTDTAAAGGILGGNNGKGAIISYCFATGTVEAKGATSFKYAGGIAGQSGTVMTGCIALNKGITGASGTTNRIAGNHYTKTITDCYASPAIPGTWSEIGATKKDGADLTSANFITSNDAFTGWVPNDWRLGDNWHFEAKDFTNLPTLMTTGLIPEDIALAGQPTIKRTDYLGLVLIDKAVTYDDALHKDKYLVITTTGILTVSTAGAQVDSLEIQPGGQVTTTMALGVTKAMSTSRTLENEWITFGAPVKMTFKAIEKGYMLQGYESSEAVKQQWTMSDLPSSDVSLPAVSPYLLAIDKGSETVSFSSDNGTLIPVVAKAESGTTLSNGIFLFRTNPSLSNQTVTNAYILSEDGTCFELQDTAYTLKPFECYVIANAVTTKAVMSLRVGNGTPTGNEPLVLPSDAFRLWGANGQLHLEASQPTDVQVYTLTGTLAHSFRLDGSRTLTLPRGIYLVRSNNITYKVSL